MNDRDLMNLCFSFLIDGGTEKTPMTAEDAAYTLKQWQEEGGELAEDTKDLSPTRFADAWNTVLNCLQH